jgi:arylformamidase
MTMSPRTRIIDISLEIKENMIVYPGNPGPLIESTTNIPQDTVNESLITFGSHCGTHVDSPKHVRMHGKTIKDMELNGFYGPCKVLDMTGIERAIHREHLEEHSICKGDIILLKTRNSLRGFSSFRRDFIHVKLDAAQYLV